MEETGGDRERIAELRKLLEVKDEQLGKAVTEYRKVRTLLTRNLHEILDLLAGVIAITQPAISGHSRRVAVLSKQLGEHLRLKQPEQELLYYTGLLHDIGLIGTDILEEKQLEDRSQLYLEHPVIGEKLIASVGTLATYARVIRSHHEDYSGFGFPDGLAGEAIPLPARIIRIANDYDNMIHIQNESREDALGILDANPDGAWDPALLRGFIDLLSSAEETQIESLRKLPVDALKPGMYLAEDIHLKTGVLLAPRGVTLKPALIERIRHFSSLLPDPLVSVGT